MVPDGKAALWRLVARGAGVIVPLNAAQAEIPFYCVHSIGGEVTSFRDLAQRLGNEVPLYGIQASKERLRKEFATSIEYMAESYVEALTLFQPEGELALGGWSAGSVIALEMAQQLRARGREIPLLVLFDGDVQNTGGGAGVWNPLCYWKWMRNLPRWIADDLVRGGGWRSAARRIQGKLNAAGRNPPHMTKRRAAVMPSMASSTRRDGRTVRCRLRGRCTMPSKAMCRKLMTVGFCSMRRKRGRSPNSLRSKRCGQKFPPRSKPFTSGERT
jgi:pimeloyl-ACP methyl ester carboxylesterase